MKTKSQPYQNSWDTVKALLRGRFVALDALFKKKRKLANQQPNFTSRSQKNKKSFSVSIGVPHLIALDFAALCRYCIFYKLMACGHPALSDAG